MEKRELICIGCPMGCPLTVELENEEIKTITGYTCKKGETPIWRDICAQGSNESDPNRHLHCKGGRRTG